MPCVAIAVLAAATTASAPYSPMPVPPEVQVLLVPKVLEFERRLGSHTGDEIVIALAHQPTYRVSQAAKADLMEAARSAPGSAHGRTLRWVSLPLTTERDLAAALGRGDVHVVYFAPMRAVRVHELARSTADRRVVSITGVPEYVSEGVAVGIGERAGKPRILINLVAARAAGADLAAHLLQLADLVESK